MSELSAYREALNYYGGLGRFGMRLGLDNMLRLLSRLGDPHLAVPTVHVAGTNGKGSTSHALHAILRSAGLRVGLYTSPHLLRFSERIIVNGHEIPRADLIRLTAAIRTATEGLAITFFEATTALAFMHFSELALDVAVIEVGLGGRLDATNVVHPLVCVITSIGLEHREHLGNSTGEIAHEKAGIIKGGRPVVLGNLPVDAERVALAIATERGAPVHRAGHEFAALREERSSAGERFWYRGRSFGGRLTMPLYGRHQVGNAALAAYTCELLHGFGLPIKERNVGEGLALTHLPGRFTEVPGAPTIILDAAHNPGACQVLAGSLHDRFGDRPVSLVFGVLDDKDHLEMLRALAPTAASIWAVRPHSPRARDPQDVVTAARELGLHAEPCQDLGTALARARAEAGHQGAIAVTGSFYTVGAAMQALGIGGEPDPIELSDPIRPIR